MQSTKAPDRPPDEIRCELVSWEEFIQLTRKLARLVRHSGFHPDMIVGISRGGLMPARLLSDYLDIFDFAAIKVEHYHGVRKARSAKIRYPFSAEITGKQVLLVDDVSDSGETFEAAIRHLKEQGRPTVIKTAVLHHKRVSVFIPDYYAKEIIEWRWITYPWAVIEDLTSFLKHMEPRPTSVEVFAEKLLHHHGIDVTQQTLEDVLTLAQP